MSDELLAAIFFYAPPLIVIWVLYSLRRSRRTQHASAILRASEADGLMQPASLHPSIDANRCLGCGSCVDACPEKQVLGLVRGRAELLTPANCIGHGACQSACPFDAIQLVLGTKERGVEVPVLSPQFETNVPGLFVAGELGGMGLIRNGIKQGKQAIDSILARDGTTAGDQLDVVIVGAGPAGLAASLAALQNGLQYRCLERETLGGTVAHYPRGKIVMTEPVELPLFGAVLLRETTKEALLELWKEVVATTGVAIDHGIRVEDIQAIDSGFEVHTAKEVIRTRSVLLAIGRRGAPRKLGVSGEEQNKVVYRMIDPEQYRGRRVLVVGGGDSALEAALAISVEEGAEVTLSYRGESFARSKPKNRVAIEKASGEGQVQVLLASQVVEILSKTVLIETGGGRKEFPNDDVIVCAGGILPSAFLESIGIEVEMRHGECS